MANKFCFNGAANGVIKYFLESLLQPENKMVGLFYIDKYAGKL